jgi:hypothetical protein
MTLPLSPLASQIRNTIRRSPVTWAHACHISLRPYQVQIARAIKDSILNNLGLTFVVILPRQSGKNEIQAHLFAWLLFRYARRGGRIVSVSPTFDPQTLVNLDRVAQSLDVCVGTRRLWKSSKGHVYVFGHARLQFYSGQSRARVVGATADLLLSVDEAQEVSAAKFDKDFDPMTASTNATRVFWGTPWTLHNLLERERRIALQSQQKDGIQRLFYFTADDIRQLVPAYGVHVDRVIAEHGRDNPRVRSQYFGETIDAQSGMFTSSRLALIHTDQIPAAPLAPLSSEAPCKGQSAGLGEGVGGGAGVGFLIDVAGMDECAGRLLADTAPAGDMSHRRSGEFLSNPGRDSTALSIVEIDLSTLESLGHPTYHVVARHSWIGENHLAVFGKLKNLAETWHPQHIVIDATGVGEGLWALLDRAFPARVIPVKFTQPEKSEVGWRFLSIIETGRFRDHVHTDEVHLQYSHCTCEILPGPLHILRWGVPEGTRGPDGGLIHDDFILADSLTAKLDTLKWHVSTPGIFVPARDPLLDIDHHVDHEYDHYFGDNDYDHFFGEHENVHYSY